MKWQNFTRGMLISTLIFGGLLLFLTLVVPPEKGLGVVLVYYLAIFFFILGLASLLSFTFRRWWNHNEMIVQNVKISIRQGVFVGGFSAALLALSAMRLLTWWDGIILAVTFILFEMYFKTRG